MARKHINEILKETGIDPQQIAECEGQTGVSLQECLLSKKYITPEQLAKALALYSDAPVVETITDEMADLTLLGKVPLKFLRDNVVMPVKIAGVPTILTSNPLNFQPIDELTMLLGGGLSFAVAPEPLIINAINRYYPLEGTKEMIEELAEESEAGGPENVTFEAIDEKDILTMASEAPIIKLVNHILFQAAKRGASDIHIEPFEKELRVRYRIDGVMYDVMNPPKRIQGALTSRIKIMANLNIAEKRLPQDGRIQIKVADRAIDIRVSVLPVAHGERIVMRLLDKSRTFAKVQDLGFSERDLAVIQRNIVKPNGILYVTGPTGSGKTSTLYSILAELNTPDVNIITVEDPVEYQMAGIGQVQVKEKVGMTFAAALRSILRQDPDIVMIGETRDQETAQIAIQAALTGHLVLSTLHTNSAPASITRLIDMGIEPFLIASSVVMVVAQRLVRKLCPDCKEKYTPTAEMLSRLGLSKKEASNVTFYKPVGCDNCLKSGYKGRIAIFEVMEMSEGVARKTMERADTSMIKKEAVKEGMTTLIDDGIRKMEEGLTSVEEVLSVATIEHDSVDV